MWEMTTGCSRQVCYTGPVWFQPEVLSFRSRWTTKAFPGRSHGWKTTPLQVTLLPNWSRSGLSIILFFCLFIDSGHVSHRTSRGSTEDRERKKKAKKNPLVEQQRLTAKKASKDKRASAGFPETNKKSCEHKIKDSRKHKRSGGKHTEPRPQSDKVTSHKHASPYYTKAVCSSAWPSR